VQVKRNAESTGVKRRRGVDKAAAPSKKLLRGRGGRERKVEEDVEPEVDEHVRLCACRRCTLVCLPSHPQCSRGRRRRAAHVRLRCRS
jgi:hypothetical protein